jgi:hypothetical protein
MIAMRRIAVFLIFDPIFFDIVAIVVIGYGCEYDYV